MPLSKGKVGLSKRLTRVLVQISHTNPLLNFNTHYILRGNLNAYCISSLVGSLKCFTSWYLPAQNANAHIFGLTLANIRIHNNVLWD
jgi:hypothetical protein